MKLSCLSFLQPFTLPSFDVVAGDTGADTQLFQLISKMKAQFMHALLFMLLWALPASLMAQVNGDFETQRAIPPQGENNVAGSYQAYDDLPAWQAVTNPAGPAAGTANYMANNAISPFVNPQGTPRGYGGSTFSPHSGIGCVVIQREPYAHTRDQFITQQVTTLSPNHSYQVNFYVLRNPFATSYEQVLFAVSNSAPTGFTAIYYNSTDQALTPTPYASFTSQPITSALTWELVTGTFVAQASSAYITIGYGPGFGQPDPSGRNFLAYAIDDVSLVDMGCAPVPLPEISIIDHSDCNKFSNYQIDNYNSAYTYTLVSNTPGLRAIGDPNTGLFRMKGTPSNSGGSFTLTVTNDCGSTVSVEDYASFSSCSMSEPIYRQSATIAYPNPATAFVTLPEGVSEVVLTNSQGKPVQAADTTGRLDVQDLPEGLYNLRMMQNGKLINQRIQVKH